MKYIIIFTFNYKKIYAQDNRTVKICDDEACFRAMCYYIVFNIFWTVVVHIVVCCWYREMSKLAKCVAWACYSLSFPTIYCPLIWQSFEIISSVFLPISQTEYYCMGLERQFNSKSTLCSFKGQEFDSQHLHLTLKSFIIQIPEKLETSPGLWRHETHM